MVVLAMIGGGGMWAAEAAAPEASVEAKEVNASESGSAGAEVSRPRWQFGFELNYALGLAESAVHERTIEYANSYMDGVCFRASAYFNINSHWTVGAGLGFDIYNRDHPTLPIFATVRYMPWTKPRVADFFFFSHLGGGISTDENRGLNGGFMADIGAGWHKMFRRHFGLEFELGYRVNQFNSDASYLTVFIDEENQTFQLYNVRSVNTFWRHSLFFGVGLIF